MRILIVVALSLAFGSGCVGLVASRHTTAVLTEPDADAALGAARSTLATIDGPGDVACQAEELERKGSLELFSTGSGIITDKAGHDALNHGHDRVKVVQQIYWCDGGYNHPVLGCSSQHGPLIVSRTGTLEGILWAHEFGHTRGLHHRNEPNAV